MGEDVKHCPHCGQVMMLYRRNIRANMLYCLRKLFFTHKTNPMKCNDIDKRSNVISDFSKLRHWGLIQNHDHNMWSITEFGIKFILGKASIRKYVWVYNNQVQPDPEGEINPEIMVWDIAPEEISKATVLSDALAYPDYMEGERQISFA
jgi:hypothetical protein